MSKYYFKYIPGRRGLSGSEMLAPWLDEFYPGVTFNPVINDGMAEFGIIEGSGDIFPKAMAAIEGRFSCARLTETVFIGIVSKYYNPIAMDGMTVPTLDEYLTGLGITPPVDKLPNVKAAKQELLKEIAKKKFSNLNDTSADLAKIIALLNLHYTDLTVGEKAQVDATTTTLKAIYSKSVCIAAYDRMVGELNSVLVPYYTAMMSVSAASDQAGVDAVVYE